MRISTPWSQQLGVNSMLAQQTKLSKTQMQLATGLKHLVPSDDPAAAARTLDLQETIAKTEQYQKNIDMARARLGAEETALMGATHSLQRARELAIQSLNDVVNPRDRLAIAQEVRQILDHIVGIANTKNANGEYLFSGDLSAVPPFRWDETAQWSNDTPPVRLAPAKGFVYQGGIHQRVLDIAPSRRIADGDLGFTVFEDIPSVSLAAVNKNGKQSIFETLETFAKALEGNFPPVRGSIVGERFLRYGWNYQDNPPQSFSSSFTLEVDEDGTNPASYSVTLDDNYASLDELIGAINQQLDTERVVARRSGNAIEFLSLSNSGERSSVRIQGNSGTFLTDAGFSDNQIGRGAQLTEPALDANGNQIVDVNGDPVFQPINDINKLFNRTVNHILTDLDAALGKISEAEARVGARLRTLDDQQDQNEKFKIDMTSVLSDTRDLDYAEAISRFNLQTIGLQAAQQAYTRVQNLSLFNYL